MTQYIHYPNSGSGVQTYPTFADFPSSAANGTLAIALDTDTLYVYDAGAMSWVAIASPGSVLAIGTFDSGVPSANGAHIDLNQLIMQSASATVPGLVNIGTQTMTGAKTFNTSILSPIISGTAANPASAGTIRLSNTQAINWRNAGNSANLGLSLDASNIFQLTSALTVTGNIAASNFSGSSSGTNTGDVTLAAVGASPSANGASLSGQVLTLQPADATHPGVLTAIAQSIGGSKTFAATINADGGIDRSTSGTLTIGATNSTTINIGNSGATVNIQGTTIYENTPQLLVADPLITINSGGGAGSGQNSGIQIEENLVITGYLETSSDRNSWILKAPNTAGIVTITPGASGFTIDQGSHSPVTLTAVGATPNANGASLSGQALTLQPANASFPGVLLAADWTTFNNKQATITIGALDAQAANATGLALVSNVLSTQSADATHPGMVNTTTQTFGGAKTFSGGVTATVTGTASGNTTISGQTNHGVVVASATNAMTSTGAGTAGQVLTSNGASADPTFQSVSAGSTPPTVQKFTSGSGTYTRPTGPTPIYIHVEMVGAGGGGAGAGTSASTAATDGTASTFGTTLLSAGGGIKGVFNSDGGNGGTSSLGTGPVGIALTGTKGGPGMTGISGLGVSGPCGGGSALGGAGAGGCTSTSTSGQAGSTNTGSGGGGGQAGGGAGGRSTGSGGGSGGYISAIITSPSSTYSYTVGAGGTAGTAGTGGTDGGAGADGIIVVTEYYQ